MRGTFSALHNAIIACGIMQAREFYGQEFEAGQAEEAEHRRQEAELAGSVRSDEIIGPNELLIFLQALKT